MWLNKVRGLFVALAPLQNARHAHCSVRVAGS
jgi:hypothetical protein